MAKTIKTPLLVREFELDRAAIDEKSRTVPLSFSSEAPVERWFGVEILDHTPSSVDLSRLNSGGALLLDHNTRDQIGVIVEQSAKIEGDKRGRAVVKFSRSARAEEIFQDVKDGIRRLVSVGYRIDKMVTEKVEKGVETLRAMSWTPLEISLVSVPADPTVGVGRSEAKSEFNTVVEELPAPTPESTPMKRNLLLDPAPANAPAGGGAAAAAVIAAQEQHRSERGTMNTNEEIQAIAGILEKRGVKIGDLANRALLSKMSVDEFRAEAMKLLPTVQPVRQADPIEAKPKDWARYSITRALRMQMPGQKRDGIEEEFNQELALRGGMQAAGLWVPREAFAMHGVQGRNFVAGTGTLGGMLVDTQNLGNQFIELLRNRAKVAMLGARMINLGTPVTIPRQNGAGSVNWVGETVAATLGTGNFTQITLTPKGLSAFQQYGKQLLFESDPSIDALIREDIMQIIALELDRVVLHGAGGSEPTGITVTTGVTTIALGANGAAFTVANGRASTVSLETAISDSNADVETMAYMTNSAMRGRLKMIDENPSTQSGRWVWQQTGGRGEVNGYRAEVSNQVSRIQTQGTATTICSSVFFGNWSEVIMASFNNGATDLLVDPYTLAANAVVRVIARHWADVGIRHGQSFSVLLGVLNS